MHHPQSCPHCGMCGQIRDYLWKFDLDMLNYTALLRRNLELGSFGPLYEGLKPQRTYKNRYVKHTFNV